MVSNIQIICLLSVIVAVTCSSTVKKEHRKSRLILEYDWPVPSKNQKRFPHPTSCVHFYHLRPDGSYHIKKCHGDEEIFDYQSLRCKEKALAKCWKDIIQKIISKKKRRHFSCPFPWGLYPDVEDCSQLYECLGGRHFLRKCPASTLFDKAERTCVSAKEAMCADESDSIDHDGYSCPYKWGFFTHPIHCSKYYECLGQVPSIRTCKKNMLFDNFERRCLPMSRVKCGARRNPYETIPTTTEQVNSKRMSTETPRPAYEQKMSTENPRTEQKVTTENPRTGYESKVSAETEIPETRSDRRVIEENLRTGEKVSTENLMTGFDLVISPGIMTTSFEEKSSAEIQKGGFAEEISENLMELEERRANEFVTRPEENI